MIRKLQTRNIQKLTENVTENKSFLSHVNIENKCSLKIKQNFVRKI